MTTRKETIARIIFNATHGEHNWDNPKWVLARDLTYEIADAILSSDLVTEGERKGLAERLRRASGTAETEYLCLLIHEAADILERLSDPALNNGDE